MLYIIFIPYSTVDKKTFYDPSYIIPKQNIKRLAHKAFIPVTSCLDCETVMIFISIRQAPS